MQQQQTSLELRKLKIWGSYVAPTPKWVRNRAVWTPFLMGRDVESGKPVFVALEGKASSQMSWEDMVFETNREYVPGEVTPYLQDGACRWVPKTNGSFGAVWKAMVEDQD